MITQVELPVPAPVAEAPESVLAQNSPAAPPTVQDLPARSGSGAIIYEDTQQGVPRQVLPEQTPPPPPPPLDPGVLLQQKRYAELEPIAQASSDTRLAAAIGWSHYNDRNYARAASWFERALSLNEENYEAAYGLALVLVRQGQYDKAEEIARWRVEEYPQMRNVLGDIITARAVAAYQAKDYRRSRELFEQVKEQRALSRDEQIVQAWNLFHSGDVTLAGEEFERLYIAKPDKFAATGVYAAYAKQKKWSRLDELSKTYRGPLAQLYNDYIVEKYYQRGLYANAYAAAPEKYPELRNYTSPSATAGGATRFKSGNSGESKLFEVRGDASGILYQQDTTRLSAKVGVISLDSGRLPNHAFVGKAPLEGKKDYRVSPKTAYHSLVDVRLRYEREGIYTPSIELGVSPAGGEVTPTIVGSVALRSTQDWGEWKAEIYRESIRESILSYTGMKDPYTGQTWGRVSDSGLNLSVFAPLQDQWNIYGQLAAGVLDGQNVASNNHFKFTLAFNKQLEHPDFAYITLGPSFTFEHYARNLSFFTFGQGGYFSPDYLFQGTLGLQFMTKEARSYLIKGGLDLGLQNYRQGATPVFPEGNTEAIYQSSDAQTFIANVNVAGLLLLSPRWALGGILGYNRTANYSEVMAGISFKYFFEPRAGLFSTDFAPY